MLLSVRRLGAVTLTLFLVAASARAQTANGYLGIYADTSGTQHCVNIPQGLPTLLYVLAKLEGTTSGGITGADFRIEVSNPAGWTIQYYAPTGPLVMGDPLDADPSQSDSSGVSIVFSSCTSPGPSGLLQLGTIFVLDDTHPGLSYTRLPGGEKAGDLAVGVEPEPRFP